MIYRICVHGLIFNLNMSLLRLHHVSSTERHIYEPCWSQGSGVDAGCTKAASGLQ